MKKRAIAVMAAMMAMMMVVTSAFATSGFGVSANTTKTKYYLATNQSATVYVKNDNTYEVLVTVTPQKYVNGKWRDELVYMTWPYAPEEIQRWDFDLDSDLTGKGTYRFKVEVKRDKNGDSYPETVGTFYTSTFTVQ